MQSEPQKPKSKSAMARLRRCLPALAVIATAILVGAIVLRATRTVEAETARRLTGDWSYVGKGTEGNDLEVVWQIRPDGTLRTDVIDVRTREKPQQWERPAVGHWKTDGKVVVFLEESWDFTYNRPVIGESRWRIESITSTQLVLQHVTRQGEPVPWIEGRRFLTRFSGWGKS